MTETLPEAPPPDEYLDEPEFDDDVEQDDEIDQPAVLGLAVRAFALVPTDPPIPHAPRSLAEANAWFRGQITARDQDWTNLCQKFSRTGPGCPGGSATALDAFFNCPREYRIVGGDPEKLEPGWQAVSRSNSDGPMARFGHIFPIIGDFVGGKTRGVSTDALRRGWPDFVNPSDLYQRWNHEYLGAIRWQNGFVLYVKDPQPVQDHKYERLADSLIDLERALRDIRAARDAARNRKDWADARVMSDRIHRLVAVKRDVSGDYETLRRVA